MFSQLYFGHFVAAVCEPHVIHTPSCQRTFGFSASPWQSAWVFKPTLNSHFWLILTCSIPLGHRLRAAPWKTPLVSAKQL